MQCALFKVQCAVALIRNSACSNIFLMAHTKHSVDYIGSKGGSLLVDSSKPQTKQAIPQTWFVFAGKKADV